MSLWADRVLHKQSDNYRNSDDEHRAAWDAIVNRFADQADRRTVVLISLGTILAAGGLYFGVPAAIHALFEDAWSLN